jgi:NADH:ubiquinone reductase (H+-translocating)
MSRPRVVIIGGGFGGLNAARALAHVPVDVTVVDRTNHHLFQPLLYQVASATLAVSEIAVPIRWVLRRQRNVTVLLAEAMSVDVARRIVQLDQWDTEAGGMTQLPYDYLVIATGTRHSYFGHPEWEPLAPGLKAVEDALAIRQRFLVAFEEAERLTDPATRRAYLTFVIVGGGATGVELAGMMPSATHRAFRREFRHIDTRETRVILLEGLPRILTAFPEALAARARHDLEQLGIEMRTGARVTRIEPDAVYVGDERIPTRTVFWAAGNAASPLGRSLSVPLDRVGRVIVGRDLSIPGHSEVFVVGDLAVALERDGVTEVPGVAPAAIQEGKHAARSIAASIAGRPRTPFRYFNKGNLATIGRNRAIADFGFLKVVGFPAWVLWLFVHVMYLVGFRNRLMVLLQWAYAYFTYDRGTRVITNSARIAASNPKLSVNVAATMADAAQKGAAGAT